MSRTPRQPTLARRALPALVLTGASGLLLSALDRPGVTVDASSGDASDLAVQVGPTTLVTTAPTTAPTAGPTTMPTAGPTTVAAAVPNDPAATATTAAPVATTAAPVTTVPAAPVCTTITGPTVSTRWGPVQVEASVTATGDICTVDAIVTPNDRSKSVRINDRAVPVLNDAALAAQGTDFDGVSGATVTSNGYKQSLQAILDSVAG